MYLLTQTFDASPSSKRFVIVSHLLTLLGHYLRSFKAIHFLRLSLHVGEIKSHHVMSFVPWMKYVEFTSVQYFVPGWKFHFCSYSFSSSLHVFLTLFFTNLITGWNLTPLHGRKGWNSDETHLGLGRRPKLSTLLEQNNKTIWARMLGFPGFTEISIQCIYLKVHPYSASLLSRKTHP